MNIGRKNIWILLYTFAFLIPGVSTVGQTVSKSWDREISVTSGVEDFDGQVLFAYSTLVYEAQESLVRNNLIDQIKSRTSEKITRKKVLSAMQVSLPKVNIDAVDIKARTLAIESTHDVKVIVTFSSGDQVVTPADFPEADKIAKEILYQLSILLNQTVVKGQIAKAQVDQSTLENKQLSFNNKMEGMERLLNNDKQKVSTLETEASDINAYQAKQKTLAARLKVLADAAGSTAADLENYDQAMKEIGKNEAQMSKNRESLASLTEKISQGEIALQEKKNEIAGVDEQLNQQRAVVASLKGKYGAIK